MDKAII